MQMCALAIGGREGSMDSTVSGLRLGCALACLAVCGLAATDASTALAQDGPPQTTLTSLTATGSTITVTGSVVSGSALVAVSEALR
ncbi:MAG: hypothetical protein ACYCUM_09290 [Solirubrobacteraceae bacterium]